MVVIKRQSQTQHLGCLAPKSKLLTTAEAAWDIARGGRLSPAPPTMVPVATLQNKQEEGAPRIAGHGWREGPGAGPTIVGKHGEGTGSENLHFPPLS